MRASYRMGIQWIADNDEPDEMDPSVIDGFISVQLLADLFGKDPLVVAKAVAKARAFSGHTPHNYVPPA